MTDPLPRPPMSARRPGTRRVRISPGARCIGAGEDDGPVSIIQALENRAYVRGLLEKKQSEFAAVLKSVERELSCSICPDAVACRRLPVLGTRCPGNPQGELGLAEASYRDFRSRSGVAGESSAPRPGSCGPSQTR